MSDKKRTPVRWSVIIPAILIVYLAVMAWYGRALYYAHYYLRYFGVIVCALAIIAGVWWVLRRRELKRAADDAAAADADDAQYGTYADTPQDN